MRLIPLLLLVFTSTFSFSQIAAFEVVANNELAETLASTETEIEKTDDEGYYFVKGFEEVSEHDVPKNQGTGKMKYYHFVVYAHGENPPIAPFLLKTEDFVDPLVLRITFEDNICTIVIKEFVKNNLGLSTSLIELQLPEH